MKYTADYAKVYYHVAVEAACDAIDSDGYYAIYDHRFGTGGILCRDRQNGCWGDWYLSMPDSSVCSTTGRFTRDQLRAAVLCREEVGWTSCAVNIAKFFFDHEDKTVTLLVASARHGIPSIASCLIGAVPAEVISYETQEPSWEWWETRNDISCRQRARREAVIAAGAFI